MTKRNNLRKIEQAPDKKIETVFRIRFIIATRIRISFMIQIRVAKNQPKSWKMQKNVDITLVLHIELAGCIKFLD